MCISKANSVVRVTEVSGCLISSFGFIHYFLQCYQWQTWGTLLSGIICPIGHANFCRLLCDLLDNFMFSNFSCCLSLTSLIPFVKTSHNLQQIFNSWYVDIVKLCSLSLTPQPTELLFFKKNSFTVYSRAQQAIIRPS